eukprot:TRINITY_DN11595_c0_g2_i2.p1 TRINITY_DN11595_c0_g2~~TRINITY_DN11595_c0_g2_i2.p1  ORF type:complete len:104 (-),score=3.58 TRINITY_DN11595_c0_g2_i2:166-477(-)
MSGTGRDLRPGDCGGVKPTTCGRPGTLLTWTPKGNGEASGEGPDTKLPMSVGGPCVIVWRTSTLSPSTTCLPRFTTVRVEGATALDSITALASKIGFSSTIFS